MARPIWDDDPVLHAEEEAERKRNEEVKRSPQGNGAALGSGGKPIRFQFTAFRDIKLSTAPIYVVDKMLPRVGVAVVWGRPKCEDFLDL